MAARVVRDDVVVSTVKSGTYRAYSKYDGELIYEKEDFTPRHDTIPFGISICMGAAELLDKKTGERIHSWNPWGQLKD